MSETSSAGAHASREYTRREVAMHKSDSDCWLILGEDGEKHVYNVSEFLDDHPGGPEIIMDMAGQDATEEFEDIGHSNDARKLLSKFLVGKLKEEAGAASRAKKAVSSTRIASTPIDSNSVNTFFITLALIVLAAAFLFKYYF
jgi:cytochrome b involved in lipid metabolism